MFLYHSADRKPEMRGKGIGRAMLAHLAKIAVERDCGRFEWSVLNWNEPAIRFYKSLGALPMDEWTTFRISVDALHKLATIIYKDTNVDAANDSKTVLDFLKKQKIKE